MVNIELTAVYDRERFRFANADGDVLISSVILDDETTIGAKGPDLTEGFASGGAYRFFGQWTNYTNKRTGETERQFGYQTVVQCAPFGQHGIVKYLQRAPGIGPAIAERLWDQFGSEAVTALRTAPDACASLRGLTLEVAREASQFLQLEFAREGCTIDLLNLLDGQGFPKRTTQRCIGEWGNQAARFVRKNPYLLMRFRGIGFKRCDQLYAHLKLPMASLKRQALCAWYGVSQAHQDAGDTWVDRGEAIRSLRHNIGGADVREQDAIELAIRGGILRATWTDGSYGPIDWDGSTCWLADARKARSESELAVDIAHAMQDASPVTSVSVAGLSDHQAEKVKWLFEQLGCLKILGGGPGTGKTYSVARIVKHLIAQFGVGKVALAAPTGKAAVRLTEAMSEYGVPLRALTWHSLLGVQSSTAGDGWGFVHGREYPLPFRVVIGDEMSMQDTTMAANVFAARERGTLFLLVGDTHQLPPVGHGAPLRDLIAAGVPYAELTELRRNSGEIAEQCRVMREEGRISLDRVDDGDANLLLDQCRNPKDQIRHMLHAIDQASHQQLDPIWDCQVLVPTNKSGDLGRKNLNKILQAQLNPEPEIKGSPFRLHDKVVCLQNGWYNALEKSDDCQTNEAGQVYVANGDVGVVVECESKVLVVKLSAPQRIVRVGRGAAKENDEHKNDSDTTNKEDEDAGTGCNWDLAYALSVHKAQGSEVPVAIVMLDGSGGARRVCSREWLYTAISRAKKYCVCIGDEATAQAMVRRTKVAQRKTFLKELIHLKELVQS